MPTSQYPTSIEPKSDYTALWVINYSLAIDPYLTDERLLASPHSIRITIEDDRTGYIP